MVKTLIVLSLLSVGSAFTTVRSSVPRARLQMGLDPVLAKSFPRDFKTIPKGTDYGTGTDEKLNNDVESRRLDYLEKDLFAVLKEAVATKQRPMFTTALIAGDAVILDALHKTGLLSKVPVIFVDTFTLFPESLAHLREVEAHYGFKSKIYNAVDCKDQEDYYSKYVLGWCGLGCDAIPCADRLVCAYVAHLPLLLVLLLLLILCCCRYGRDYWRTDIDRYDMLCKVRELSFPVSCLPAAPVPALDAPGCPSLIPVSFHALLLWVVQVEPMNRALKEQDSDAWINGRRRDHGAERAALPVWEGKKLNPLAFWSFEVRRATLCVSSCLP